MVTTDTSIGEYSKGGRTYYYTYIRGQFQESVDRLVVQRAVERAREIGLGLHLMRRYFCGFPYVPPARDSREYHDLPRVRLLRPWGGYEENAVFMVVETIHCGPRCVLGGDGASRIEHPTNLRVVREGECLPSVEEGSVTCRTIPGEITVQADSIMTAVRHAQGEAEIEARTCGHRFIRSRGRFLVSSGNAGVCRPFEPGECVFWKGTLKDIREAVMLINERHPEVTELCIDGGFDGSDDFGFEEYDPWISSWSVKVWTRAKGLLYKSLN